MRLFTRFRFTTGAVIVLLALFILPMAVLAQATSPHLIVNTAFLNIRSGPGVSYDVIATVPGGAKLPVLAIDSGRLWYQVSSIGGNGWVNSFYTVGRGNFSGLPVTSDDPPPITGPHLVVNTAFLNIRSGPGADYDVVATVSGGTKLPVIAIDKGRLWYQVSLDDVTGWVNSFYTVGRGNFSGLPVTSDDPPPISDDPPPISGSHLVVNTAFLNIRSGPGADYDVVATVSGGTELPVIAIDNGRLWYQVSLDDVTGWVNSFYTVERGSFSRLPVTSDDPPPISGPHLVINTAFLNIRSGPGAEFGVIGTASGGDKFPVLAMHRDRLWYQVETGVGNGWVNSSYAVGRGNFSNVPVSSG